MSVNANPADSLLETVGWVGGAAEGYVRLIDQVQGHWSTCVRLVQKVPVFRAAIDFDLNQLDRSYAPLLRHVTAVLNRSPED